MTQKTMPEWATKGATVYAREYNNILRGGEAILRKGIITRVTAASIFVRVNTAAGAAAGEDRYTLQRWNDAPELHGHKSEHYTRTLVSEEQGRHELEGIAKRRHAKGIMGKAQRAAQDVTYTLTPTTARQAIEALQAYLELAGE